MPRHVDVWLNGISLRSAAPRLAIQNVAEEVGALDVVSASILAAPGQQVASILRRSLKVTITLQVLEVRDLAARAMAVEAVAAWAAHGGELTVSYRPDRRLRVRRTKPPVIGKARDYAQEITVELTAYEVPYWESTAMITATGTDGASGSVSLAMPCTAPAPMLARIVPAATLQNISVGVNGDTITLGALNAAAGSVLLFDRTDGDLLKVTLNGAGVLNHRTAASADDLILRPGANTAAWSASVACAVTFSGRGRFE